MIQRSSFYRWLSSVPVCTPFSRLPQAQLMRLDSFFSGALCVLSGGRLPEALFMVFYWIPKVQHVNPADLDKCYEMSPQLKKLASIQPRTDLPNVGQTTNLQGSNEHLWLTSGGKRCPRRSGCLRRSMVFHLIQLVLLSNVHPACA